MKTARELFDYLKKAILTDTVPAKIDDVVLTILSTEHPLYFSLEQDDRVPLNVVPDENVSVRFRETEEGLFSELFMRKEPNRPYLGPRPKREEAYLWKWEDDTETFLLPFLENRGCTNLHEILRTIAVSELR